MKYVCETSSSDENWNGDCDFVSLEITPEDAQRYLKYREAYEAAEKLAGSVYCLEIFDYSCQAFHYFDGIDELLDAGEEFGQRIQEMAADFEVPEDAYERTECDAVKVMRDGIMFNMFIKHTSVEITTPTFTWERIERIEKIANKIVA